MVYTLGGSALDTTLNTLATLFLLEIDDIVYASIVDVRYKRSARRHGLFVMRAFDYCVLDVKRTLLILACVPLMCAQIVAADPNFVRNTVNLFFFCIFCLGFIDVFRDPIEGRRIISFFLQRLSCCEEGSRARKVALGPTLRLLVSLAFF